VSTKTDNPVEVRGLLIPTAVVDLLLPNASLSEIIDYRNPSEIPQGKPPAWLLGTVMWRQRAMPVISIERMMNQPFDANAPKLRIAVCYGLGTKGTYPYVGLVAKGVPRMVRVTESTISIADSSPVKSGWPIRARVNIQDREALIPDLMRVEQMLGSID
jgi:chemosensory pili system protein ChpC